MNLHLFRLFNDKLTMLIPAGLDVIGDRSGEPEDEKMEEKEKDKIAKQEEKDWKDEEERKEKEEKRIKEEHARRNEEEIKMREDDRRWVEKREKMIGEEQKQRKKIEEEKRKGKEGGNLMDRIEINHTAVSPTAENETLLSSDRNRPGERERDLIPKDSYLSQSQRDSSPLSENRSNISSVRNENRSQSSRDVSPASGSSPSIDGYNPHTLRDVSPQERQRDVTPTRVRHKSLTSGDSGQQSRADNNTASKNTHTQERQKYMTPPRDQKSASKRRRHTPDRELHDKYQSHQPRSDSPSRERNFSHKDVSPRQRRHSVERSPSPPRGKLRDHLHQQGRHPQPRARHERDPPRRRHSHKPHRSRERSPPRTEHRDLTPPTGRYGPHDISPSRERYDRDPSPPRNKDRYSWEPNPTRDRARHDRDLHKYGREPNPYRERHRYDRNSNSLRERDRYDRDHYPPRERYDKYEGESKLPHERYGRPTPRGPSPLRRDYQYDSRWMRGSQIQRYSNIPPQRNSYGQMSRESGYRHSSPRYGYDQYDSDEDRRRFDEETRRQNVYRHPPLQRKLTIIYGGGWY